MFLRQSSKGRRRPRSRRDGRNEPYVGAAGIASEEERGRLFDGRRRLVGIRMVSENTYLVMHVMSYIQKHKSTTLNFTLVLLTWPGSSPLLLWVD